MKITESDRILVVAPHPDDESIGCGGLLAKYGPQCDILVLSDGRKGYRSTDTVDEEALVRTREEELLAVARMAGAKQTFFLRIPDGTVADHRKAVEAFDLTPYSLVLSPNGSERHRDHCVVTALLQEMKRRQGSRGLLYEYEVWSPLAAPTHVLDISDVIETKLDMVSQYQSQTKYVDYRSMALGLSQYRGAGFSCTYGEAYRFVPYRSRLAQLYDRLPGPVGTGLRTIRSMLRKTRKE